MSDQLDHIIVGGGVMGLATAWQLAARGQRVRLLERFEAHHTRGASHGSTRNINNAYSEEHYLTLLDEAMVLWRELEAGAPAPLLGLHGLVTQGDEDTVRETHAALVARGADAVLLDPADAAARWGGMRFAGPVLLTREAGIGYAARALDAFAAAATAGGAVIERGARVHAVLPGEQRTAVEFTDASGARRTLTAPSVIVAAGAWSRQLLADLVELPQLRVTEEHPAHFAPRDPGFAWPSFNHVFADDQLDARGGNVYGMPSPGEGVKVGLHLVGHEVDPDARTFGATPEVRAALREHVAEWFPGLDPDRPAEISCTYTSTESGRFVLDRVGSLTVAAGFSGHGYKFAPAIGRVLADAALGRAEPPAPFRLAAHRDAA
ncbi:FAD-dependent oxidoreductase [Leucobacter chromiireducens]|uniref:FAD-dependent oxidoreductase n=1 Tax=Leucobacter chromiireducens TaxID=283877 RepID=UPI000F63A6EA|nr:FAD-dependent oxidoreductase [Leucobacter chromiireducens]